MQQDQESPLGQGDIYTETGSKGVKSLRGLLDNIKEFNIYFIETPGGQEWDNRV